MRNMRNMCYMYQTAMLFNRNGVEIMRLSPRRKAQKSIIKIWEFKKNSLSL